MKQLTKEQIIAEVKKLDPKLTEKDEAFKIATILLTALQTGADTKKISKFLNIPEKELKTYEKHLRESGVWTKDKTIADWFGKDGGISFWMDVAIAQGYITRVKAGK
jgi:mannose/fructose/N-acetylgalactosamine-specific phosphotransferase system component IIB